MKWDDPGDELLMNWLLTIAILSTNRLQYIVIELTYYATNPTIPSKIMSDKL